MSLPPAQFFDLMRRYGVRPDKRLGQNFLFDPAALERIIQAGEIQPDWAVLEVGPGLGSLTARLAEEAGWVTAVEIDKRLMTPLEEVLAALPNVELVQGDILALDPAELMRRGEEKPLSYIVVSNIPYYITSALIRHLLECAAPPHRLVLTVQNEVAERICAQPGDMSLLALSVQVYGAPHIAARIPSGAFYPPPKVDSAVIRVDRYPQALLPPAQVSAFFKLAKAGFSQKRKTLRNALSGGMHWPKEQAAEFLQSAGIDPQRRAETLNLDEWGKLTNSYSNGDY